MNKTILGFATGLVIGFGLSFLFKSSPPPATQQKEAVETCAINQQAKTSPTPDMQMMGTQHLSQDPNAVQSSQPNASTEAEPPSPNTLNLDISEEQVEAMEQNLPELQQEVSLYKDDQGWTVHLHHQSNLIASLGLQDNDVIRFDQMQELKKDPTKENLISRLEVIFSSLER